jgi:PAS domain S-box-containing protein
LRAIFDTVPVAMLIVDPDFNVSRYNAAAAKLIGFGCTEASRERLGDLLHCVRAHYTRPTQRKTRCSDCVIRDAIEAVLQRNQEVQGVETPLQLLIDGQLREYFFSVSASRLTLNGVLHVLLAMADITERVHAETQLRASKERLSLVLEGTNVGVWDWNIQTGETVFDERWASLLGYTLEELQPVSIKTWTSLADSADLQRSNLLLEEHFLGKQPLYDCECRMRHKNGSWVWIHDRGKVVEWTADYRPLRMMGTHADITERKRFEERLRESQNNFRDFFETIDDMVMVAGHDGMILWTNSAVTRKLGYSLDELAHMHVLDTHRPEDRAQAEDILREMQLGRLNHCPLPMLTKTGRLIPVETRTWQGRWSRQDATYAIVKDLTAQRAALEMFEKVFEANPAPMALSCGADRTFLRINRAFHELTGYTQAEAVGRTPVELNLFVDPTCQQQIFDVLRQHGSIRDSAITVRTRNGELRHGLLFGEVVEIHTEQFFLTTMIDVTIQTLTEQELRSAREDLEQRVSARTAELTSANDALSAEITVRRRAEMDLEDHRRQLRELASQQTLSEEDQRHELSVQLHDTIGQELAMARLRLEQLRDGPPSKRDRHLKVASDLLEAATHHVHSLTHELGATVLYQLGLPAALRSLGNYVAEQHEVAFSFVQQGEYVRLDKAIEVQLYRAARELVYNVLKHAQATTIAIQLDISNVSIALHVCDDGCGFPPDECPVEHRPTKGSFGLFSIREKMTILGGRLDIVAGPVRGTVATVTIPLSTNPSCFERKAAIS